MKIDCIRTHHLRDELDEPFGFSQWYYSTRNTLWVEIVADDGTTGWGECYGPAEVYQAAITSFYAPRLLGLDPLATDRLWHNMWQWSLDFARGGIMMGAMSGIDMALWDLKGKSLGLSVSELMGGRYRESLPCYATGMYFKDMPEDALLDSLVAEAVGYREQGFQAMKIKVGKNLDFDTRQIAAMREAMPDTTLMADSNHAYDLPEAIRIGRVLDEHGYAWFEEPLSPEYESQFRQLHDKIDVPIATGECEQTRYGFQRLLSTGRCADRPARSGLLWRNLRGVEDPDHRFVAGRQCHSSLLGNHVEPCRSHPLPCLGLSRTWPGRRRRCHPGTRSHAEPASRRTVRNARRDRSAQPSTYRRRRASVSSSIALPCSPSE